MCRRRCRGLCARLPHSGLLKRRILAGERCLLASTAVPGGWSSPSVQGVGLVAVRLRSAVRARCVLSAAPVREGMSRQQRGRWFGFGVCDRLYGHGGRCLRRVSSVQDSWALWVCWRRDGRCHRREPLRPSGRRAPGGLGGGWGRCAALLVPPGG